jgi:hypothetical protein
MPLREAVGRRGLRLAPGGAFLITVIGLVPAMQPSARGQANVAAIPGPRWMRDSGSVS